MLQTFQKVSGQFAAQKLFFFFFSKEEIPLPQQHLFLDQAGLQKCPLLADKEHNEIEEGFKKCIKNTLLSSKTSPLKPLKKSALETTT